MAEKEKRNAIEQRIVHRDQLVTLGDLELLKQELINEIRKSVEGQVTSTNKKWMKSSEVKKLLSMSTGTLQTLRMNGTLSHSKIGGIIYYSSDEIQKLLKNNEQR